MISDALRAPLAPGATARARQAPTIRVKEPTGAGAQGVATGSENVENLEKMKLSKSVPASSTMSGIGLKALRYPETEP